MTTTVPAPSEAMTTASSMPEERPKLRSSDAPNPTNGRVSVTSRRGVHMPHDEIRFSTFAFTVSLSMAETGQANFFVSGHEVIRASPTSTTSPFRITTRHLPIASIICSSVCSVIRHRVGSIFVRSILSHCIDPSRGLVRTISYRARFDTKSS